MKRRHHKLLPPPPCPSWQEQANTLERLDEPFAPLLWCALRAVQLWLETRPDQRAALFGAPTATRREWFAAARAREPVLAGAMTVFEAAMDSPAEAEAGEVAAACDGVRAWAEGKGQTRVAALFAEWAAFADPASAARANHAGRLCRRTAQAARAEVWYDRALKLGIRSKEPDQQLRAQLGYGNLLMTTGRFDEARGVLVRAVRRATRHNRKKVAAEAYHDLLILEAESGNVPEIERRFTSALMLYPFRHPRLPVLVQDWGGMLLRQNHYAAAVAVLELVLPVVTPDRNLEALRLSTLAFAYSAMGDGERFQAFAGTALRIGNRYDEYRPAVLENVAQGWRGQRVWEKARSYAEAAIEAAGDVGDRIVEHTATVLAGEIEQRIPLADETAVEDQVAFAELLDQIRRKLRWWSSKRGASHPSTPDRISVPRAAVVPAIP